MNTQFDSIKLAQSSKNTRALPEPVPGQRIILDDQAQQSEVMSQEAPPLIPHSMYYGLGAVALFVVAVLAAISFMANNKKKHRQELLGNKIPFPKFVSTAPTVAPKPTSTPVITPNLKK